MFFEVVRELPGRIRLRSDEEFSCDFGYGLEKYLASFDEISTVRSNWRNKSLVIDYEDKNRDRIREILGDLKKALIVPLENEERSMNDALLPAIENKIFSTIGLRLVSSYFLPPVIGKTIVLLKSLPLIKAGLKSLFKFKVNVDVLDGAAVGISLLQGNYSTAANTVLLLSLSDILEDWTKKKTNLELVKSLKLNIDKVLKVDGEESYWIPVEDLEVDDIISVEQGTIVPVDGIVEEGLASIDESKMTGESELAIKKPGSVVFASTVVGEGSIKVRVTSKMENSRINKIIEYISEAERGKAFVERRFIELADKIVPLSFISSTLAYFFTGSVIKATSILMVDYSCAIKLSTPLSIISAIKQASDNNILVKGGRFLEEIAEADTFVFDKTGTLTISNPEVEEIVSLSNYPEEELLRMAACIEEHFPHPMGRAIVRKAKELGLNHEENHADVNYIVAHGISTTYDEKEVIIGSYHYIIEDSKAELTEANQRKIDDYKKDYSLIFMAEDKKLIGFICLNDPLRQRAVEDLEALRKDGVKNIYMLTGDGERAAFSVAKKLKLTGYRSELLPDEKLEFLKKLKENGNKVAMVGDGINDSPALALADVSISLRDASDLAKDVSDMVIQDGHLSNLVVIRQLGDQMMTRINRNIKNIIEINSLFMLLGFSGVLTPSMTSLLHNLSTLVIGQRSTRKYKLEKEEYVTN